MKRLLSLIALAPTAVFAQAFGTKKDLPTSAGAASGPAVQGMDILQMLLALAVVGILLKWGLPKLLGKFNGWKSSQNKSGMTITESIAVGAGTVQIVEVRGRTLLLGATPTQINFLADLTVSAPVETEEEIPAFFDILDEEMENPSVSDKPHPAFAIIETEVDDEPADNMSLDEAARLLEQAKKRRAARNSDDDDNPFDRINRLIG
jgi:flagellar biogenesis protein FliO